jgi:predicted ATP-dependent endonuclease of OLD family
MQLVQFTVQDYRSITKAYKLPIDRSTILVGPNNEGKSNILKALVTAMRILTSDNRNPVVAGARPVLPRSFQRDIFDWARDYPVQKQEKYPNGESILIPEFSLSEQETADFKSEIQSNLKETLPLRIALGPAGVKVTVNKKGRGAKTLSKKSQRIAAFVADRLDFDYIPAVRTANSAREIVDGMVERELRSIEANPEYQEALDRITALQQPILDRLSETIHTTLVQFLPDVRDVKVRISEAGRNRALRRSSEIMIDDGAMTELQYKGDGVQSLAALGIMRHASDHRSTGKNLIIAIEEPESHLHPNAVHSLRGVVEELADSHQVVVTTHCPLFVDRAKVSSNIIVNNRKATPARNIEEIRDCLGVRASDNLRHAEIVLLVEGEDDRIALKGLLPKASPAIRHAMKNGTLAIDSLGGGSNLAYKVGLLRDALCLCHCFLDDDSAGRDGFAKAQTQGLLTVADVTFSTCAGMNDAEIEDVFVVAPYAGMIQSTYGVVLNVPHFKTSGKWSNRLRETFKAQGKPWNDQIEAEVKYKVANVIAGTKLDDALNQNKRNSFDALVGSIERLTTPQTLIQYE